MKIFCLIFLFILLSGINCRHLKIVSDLIKDTKYKLKGTFTINSATIRNKYITINGKMISFSHKKQKFAIIEINNSSYYIISRHYKGFLGMSKKDHQKLVLYTNIDKSNEELIQWDLIKHASKLTKSGIVYTIKNNYNNYYLCYKNNAPALASLPDNPNLLGNFQFRILKLYSEEENIIPSNYEIVEKEPIDVFIKYIDLTDKNLKREGINQIVKDYDCEELRYSLRSIFAYIPWVRKIFIVMPNEKVKFLKPYEEIKDRIVYVKDKDLLGYDTANIFAFSFNLHKMEKFGISKNFIYMEDDFFFGKPLEKKDFFYYDEKEQKVFPFVVNNLYREINVKQNMGLYYYIDKQKEKIKVHGHRGWVYSVLGTDKYFIEKYTNLTNIIQAEFTHNAFPVNIDDLKEIFNEIQGYQYINETLYSNERHLMSLNQPEFHNLYQLNIKQRKVNSIPSLYINMEVSKMYMLRTDLFVLNTCGDNIPTEKDYKHLKSIMQKRFPGPTIYELEGSETKEEIVINYLNQNKISKNGTIEVNLNNSNDTIKNTRNIRKKNYKYLFGYNKNKKLNYAFHGYILLGILFGLIIFIKYKNMYEFEY